MFADLHYIFPLLRAVGHVDLTTNIIAYILYSVFILYIYKTYTWVSFLISLNDKWRLVRCRARARDSNRVW